MTDNKDKYIKLDSFLKLKGLSESGGHGKQLIQEGYVKVNGEIEVRRGRKLRLDDKVQIEDQTVTVESEDVSR